MNILSKKPKNRKANKGMHEYIPYEKYNITEFEIQIAWKRKRSVKFSDSHSKHNTESVMNKILSNITSDNEEEQEIRDDDDWRRITVHGYEDYSDEEKEYSTTQIIHNHSDATIKNNHNHLCILYPTPKRDKVHWWIYKIKIMRMRIYWNGGQLQ